MRSTVNLIRVRYSYSYLKSLQTETRIFTFQNKKTLWWLIREARQVIKVVDLCKYRRAAVWTLRYLLEMYFKNVRVKLVPISRAHHSRSKIVLCIWVKINLRIDDWIKTWCDLLKIMKSGPEINRFILHSHTTGLYIGTDDMEVPVTK